MRRLSSSSLAALLLVSPLAHAEDADVELVPLVGDEPDEDARAGAGTELEGAELKDRAGTFGDPLRAMLLEPGVAHVLSGTSAPVVRGLAPSATQVLLDGVRMPVLAHLFVGPGVVHPDFVSSLELHRGTSPARFGRALGSVVELGIDPANGEPRRSRFSAQLDLLNLGVFADHEVLPDVQVTAAGRFGYSPWLGTSAMNLMSSAPEGRPESDYVAEVYDYQARIRHRFADDGELRLLAFGSSDRGGIRSEGDSIVLGSSFHRVDLRLTSPAFGGTVVLAGTAGFDALDVDGAGGPTSKLFSTLSEQTFAARGEYRLPLSAQWHLRLGGDVERRGSSLDQATVIRPGTPENPDRPEVESRVVQPIAAATFAGIYADAEFEGNGWRVLPGLRLDAYDRDGSAPQLVVEPRVLASRRLSDALNLRGSAGLFHQPPAYLIELPSAAAANLAFGLQRAVEVGLGADYVLGGAPGEVGTSLFSLDLFSRPYAELQELSLGELDFFAQDLAARAEQRREQELAFGFELAARTRLTERLDLRGAYSFVSSTRTAEIERRDAFGNVVDVQRASYQGALVQSHVFNASASYELGAGFVVAANLHFNTGAPEAGNHASFSQREGIDVLDGDPRWRPADRDRVALLPAFFRVDARIAKRWTTGALAWEASLDVLNLSLQREVFRYNYGVNEDGQFERGPMGLPPITLPFLALKVSG